MENKNKTRENVSGENNHNSKLTENHVLEIRELLSEKTMKQADIAKMFNVTQGNLTCIKKRKTWRHI